MSKRVGHGASFCPGEINGISVQRNDAIHSPTAFGAMLDDCEQESALDLELTLWIQEPESLKCRVSGPLCEVLKWREGCLFGRMRQPRFCETFDQLKFDTRNEDPNEYKQSRTNLVTFHGCATHQLSPRWIWTAMPTPCLVQLLELRHQVDIHRGPKEFHGN